MSVLATFFIRKISFIIAHRHILNKKNIIKTRQKDLLTESFFAFELFIVNYADNLLSPVYDVLENNLSLKPYSYEQIV